MQALSAYQRHLSQTGNTDTAGLLLRVNSAAHVRAALPALLQRARKEYAQLLQQFQMNVKSHVATLEDAMATEAQVRAAALQACETQLEAQIEFACHVATVRGNAWTTANLQCCTHRPSNLPSQ